jgi:hypothetical protein
LETDDADAARFRSTVTLRGDRTLDPEISPPLAEMESVVANPEARRGNHPVGALSNVHTEWIDDFVTIGGSYGNFRDARWDKPGADEILTDKLYMITP